ncbi:hypothetical protein STRIP9103_01445 [Streptomyces ipomoeae 91-03]|uniref:Uncharacterized protein n=1 Tax=Streptomyces ipomoeae 91-03 TaxID=698759 RepID=L1KK56_9ACTN|nr:hypothetical protein STRIP9103_01445 [Streptomyces ipomoeae 91-03]
MPCVVRAGTRVLARMDAGTLRPALWTGFLDRPLEPTSWTDRFRALGREPTRPAD